MTADTSGKSTRDVEQKVVHAATKDTALAQRVAAAIDEETLVRLADWLRGAEGL